jgi:hypothetical protein
MLVFHGGPGERRVCSGEKLAMTPGSLSDVRFNQGVIRQLWAGLAVVWVDELLQAPRPGLASGAPPPSLLSNPTTLSQDKHEGPKEVSRIEDDPSVVSFHSGGLHGNVPWPDGNGDQEPLYHPIRLGRYRLD